MTRTDKFNSYKTHAWFHKIYKRLTQEELELAHQFIRDNDPLDRGEFERKVNRMFLYNSSPPKHWSILMELLTCCNH